jgi:hypothetical protein
MLHIQAKGERKVDDHTIYECKHKLLKECCILRQCRALRQKFYNLSEESVASIPRVLTATGILRIKQACPLRIISKFLPDYTASYSRI